MKNENWHVIGLMSGTSLDGLDLVYVKFSVNNGYEFDILQSKSINYSEIWKKKLSGSIDMKSEELVRLNADYGRFLGDRVLDFTRENSIEKVDLVASHGHTVFHCPDLGYTLQIGSGADLAARTGFRVINDFRTQDVALGGQGAPLVPVGDRLLFSEYDFCLNLGGFGNISYESGHGSEDRIAFDICPVNIVMNHYTRKQGMEYDEGGSLASAGSVSVKLLNDLNALSFYNESPPKSLGLEWVIKEVFPRIDALDLTLPDLLRTFAEHAAIQIASIINPLAEGRSRPARVLITGGGAFNSFFIERLTEHLNAEVSIPSRQIVEFKEALIFALLGLLREQGEVNCLSSVTGASRDHCSGVIH